MEEVIRMEALSFSYEEERKTLDAVSVSLCRGEKIAVLGNNGAGKSTFFLCCNGVLRPTGGKLYLHDRPVSDKKADRLALGRTVGLVFQDPDVQLLAPTVQAEVSFGPMNLRLPKDEVRRRVDEAIEKLGLEPLRHRPPHQLSGGEKKRVTLADILAMEPEILLLDEPASSLDPANSRLLEVELNKLQSLGMTLVVATHDVDFAWRWAKRVLVFSQGRLLRDAAPEAVFADESLLRECGLEQPLLYQVGCRLGLNPLPRTVDQIPEPL